MPKAAYRSDFRGKKKQTNFLSAARVQSWNLLCQSDVLTTRALRPRKDFCIIPPICLILDINIGIIARRVSFILFSLH